MPFKRYEIRKVFRNGPVKTGRLREFYQADIDVVGSKSMLAEAELMSMVFYIFDNLKLEVYIERFKGQALKIQKMQLSFTK